MASVVHPTVVIGLDAFGRRVCGRLRQATNRDDVMLRLLDTPNQDIAAVLGETLDDLLRAGRVAGDLRQRRLDVVLFANALDGSDTAMADVVKQCADVVGGRFAALFPAGRPPEQRNASLHAVVRMPPMGPGGAAAKAASRLATLRDVKGSYPLLARVWLTSDHTTAGTVSERSLEAGCAAFVLASFASGLRDTNDAILRRLAHLPAGDPAFAFLSVASLDLPEGRLRRYAVARAAYDALRTLVQRVERPADRSAGDSVAMTTLDLDGLLSPFLEGSVAQQVRKSAARLSGADDSKRARIAIGAYDRPSTIRAKYSWLFEPATVIKEATRQDRTILDDVLRAMDRAEWSAGEEVRNGIVRLFDDTLGQATGLNRVPEVELGLRHVVAALHDQESSDLSQAEAPPDIDPDPLRTELEQAVDRLPSSGMLVAVSGAVGLAAAFVVMALTAFLVAPDVVVATAAVPASGPAAVVVAAGTASPGIDWSLWAPWLAAIPVFPLAAIAWSFIVGRHTRNSVVEALEARREAVEELRAQGGGGAPGRQAEAQLLLRRRRVRRAAGVNLDHASEQLTAVRRTLLEARDAFRQRLVDLRIDPAEDASADDLRGLLGQGELLHDHLVPPAIVSQWVARCRVIAEPDMWANRLLDATWPSAGLLRDVPCGDNGVILKLSEDQVQPLSERVLFESQDAANAAAGVVQSFVERCAAALAPPCDPRNAHGDIPAGIRSGEILCTAPLASRDVLGDVLRDAAYPVKALWTDRPQPRVVFLRTWEGLTLEDVARGAGLELRETT